MIYKKTKLYQEHLNLKGNMVPFSGFLLPTHYTSIKEEHLAVRNSAGLFDVSHMGEILIDGPESERFLNYVSTNDVKLVTTLPPPEDLLLTPVIPPLFLLIAIY